MACLIRVYSCLPVSDTKTRIYVVSYPCRHEYTNLPNTNTENSCSIRVVYQIARSSWNPIYRYKIWPNPSIHHLVAHRYSSTSHQLVVHLYVLRSSQEYSNRRYLDDLGSWENLPKGPTTGKCMFDFGRSNIHSNLRLSTILTSPENLLCFILSDTNIFKFLSYTPLISTNDQDRYYVNVKLIKINGRRLVLHDRWKPVRGVEISIWCIKEKNSMVQVSDSVELDMNGLVVLALQFQEGGGPTEVVLIGGGDRHIRHFMLGLKPQTNANQGQNPHWNKELLNGKTSQIFELQEAKPDRVDVDPRDFESKSLNRKKITKISQNRVKKRSVNPKTLRYSETKNGKSESINRKLEKNYKEKQEQNHRSSNLRKQNVIECAVDQRIHRTSKGGTENLIKSNKCKAIHGWKNHRRTKNQSNLRRSKSAAATTYCRTVEQRKSQGAEEKNNDREEEQAVKVGKDREEGRFKGRE
ncbi:hypothetical protein LXL04_022856 [Taraxacum kok-saghyz]